MKIKTDIGRVSFDVVDIGEVFLFSFNYFMKTKQVNNWNAINIETGVQAHFNNNDRIVLVDCELLIRGGKDINGNKN